MLRGAGVDAQDFGHLWPFGTGTGANLECRARRHGIVAAALDHTHMQKGIAGPIGKLDETESLVGIVPFDDGLDRGTGGRVKPLAAKLRCRPETAPGCFEVVVVKAAVAGLAKISVSASSLEFLGPSGMLAL